MSLAWVVDDTVYGHLGNLRFWMADPDQTYLQSVPAHETFLLDRYEYAVGEVYAALAEGGRGQGNSARLRAAAVVAGLSRVGGGSLRHAHPVRVAHRVGL